MINVICSLWIEMYTGFTGFTYTYQEKTVTSRKDERQNSLHIDLAVAHCIVFPNSPHVFDDLLVHIV